MQSRLLVPNCPHAGHALFSPHYLRSNRTRAPKVLRCFPHCCPGHRARSYCGAPIHVEVSLAGSGADPTASMAASAPREHQGDGGQVRNDPDLLVYGHFERESGDEEPATDLAVGEQVRLQDILTNGSSWVRGLASTTASSAHNARARVFTFNDDEYCHWLYDWNSGTSQRERARLHYFRVYVFQCVGRSSPSSSGSSSASSSLRQGPSWPSGAASLFNSESASFLWQVVSVVSSPGFTISAFRKEASTPSVGDSVLPVEASSTSPLVPPGSGISQQLHLDRRQEQVAGSNRYYNQQQQLPEYEGRDLHPPYDQDALFLAQWTRAHPEAVAKSTRLALAALVLSQLDVNWLDPAQFAPSLFGLLRQWPSDVPDPPSTQHREDMLWHFANYVAPKLLSLYGTSISSVSGQSSSSVGLQQASEFAEIGFSLFCHLLDESQWGNVRNALMRDAADSIQFDKTTLEDAERVTNAVATFHDALEFQTSAWLARRGLSLESLVDDLVTCVVVDRTRLELFPATLDRHVLALLRNEELLGVDLVAGQFHELQKAAARHLARDLPRGFGRFGGVGDQSMTTRRCRLNGEWVCRAVDVDHVDSRAWAASPSHAQMEPNPRVRLGTALSSLLLSAGFQIELKDVCSSSSDRRRSHYSRDVGGGGGGGIYSEEEEEGIADGGTQPTRLQLEISALMSLFPEVRARLELDGDLRALPALANGLASSWLGSLVFPFDDGVVDYSAYLMASTSAPTSRNYRPDDRRQDAGEDEDSGLELFLSFFYYANDGIAYRFRVGLSEDPSASRWASGGDRLNVFVQVAVGFIDHRSSDAVPDRVEWGQLSSRERHGLIGTWESLAVFHLLYDRVARTPRAGEGDDPMVGGDDGGRTETTPRAVFPLHPQSSRHSHRDGGFALV